MSSFGYALGGKDAIIDLEIYVCHDGDVYVSRHATNHRGPEWGDGR